MARKGKSTEEIIGFLREAEVRLGQGETAGKICRSIGISEQTYYKWRREYGGLKIDQAKRLKELERENDRLKRAVSELTLDNEPFPRAPPPLRNQPHCQQPKTIPHQRHNQSNMDNVTTLPSGHRREEALRASAEVTKAVLILLAEQRALARV